jgi:hypothetical protein
VLWVRRARRSPPHFAARSDLLTFFLACTSDQRRARRLECDGPLYRAGSLQVRCVHHPLFSTPALTCSLLSGLPTRLSSVDHESGELVYRKESWVRRSPLREWSFQASANHPRSTDRARQRLLRRLAVRGRLLVRSERPAAPEHDRGRGHRHAELYQPLVLHLQGV